MAIKNIVLSFHVCTTYNYSLPSYLSFSLSLFLFLLSLSLSPFFSSLSLAPSLSPSLLPSPSLSLQLEKARGKRSNIARELLDTEKT